MGKTIWAAQTALGRIARLAWTAHVRANREVLLLPTCDRIMKRLEIWLSVLHA